MSVALLHPNIVPVFACSDYPQGQQQPGLALAERGPCGRRGRGSDHGLVRRVLPNLGTDGV